jgi:methylmalonyl-CoA epimerase
LWQKVAGAVVDHREVVSEQHVEVVMLRIGSLTIELIQPTSDDSPVARFLATRGEGVHHIALGCDSAQMELDRTLADGVRLIDEVVRMGAEHSLVGFVHPRSLAGVLLEFVDHAGQT